MVDSVPAELLELQTRFETWRANRKYVRESIPDELRSAALEALRSYPPSLVHRVLKLDPSRLRNKPPAKRSAHRTATPHTPWRAEAEVEIILARTGFGFAPTDFLQAAGRGRTAARRLPAPHGTAWIRLSS